MPSGAFNIIKETVRKKELIEGGQIEKFEQMFSQYVGLKHGIAVGSGRMALYLALKVLGVVEGDEVIVPSYTCPVVPSVVLSLGAIPVFVDVELRTFNLDPDLIESRITKRTKVIIATHIEGYPYDIDRITEIAYKYNLKIIEDCAQSIGAEYKGEKVGCFGALSYFSFAAGKQLNTLGGSIILTNDGTMDNRLREEVKNYKLPSEKTVLSKLAFACFVDTVLKSSIFNWTVYPVLLTASLFDLDLISLIFEDKGDVQYKIHKFREKYSNIQAYLGKTHLANLGEQNDIRRQKAGFLDGFLLKEVNRRAQPAGIRAIYHYYSILTARRKHIAKILLRHGYDTQPTWNCSCSGLEMFGNYRRDCPVSTRLEKEVLYLPMHDQLSKLNLENLAKIINKSI
jgi:dTDP-4-amino-4,6-dideoxygalactose transaminase